MTVRLASDGAILLEGVCPVDDAEPLQQLLLSHPRGLWWTGAVANTPTRRYCRCLMVARPEIRGPARAAFLQDWMVPLLVKLAGLNWPGRVFPSAAG